MSTMGDSVRVCCRFRPMNDREITQEQSAVCVQFPSDNTCLVGPSVHDRAKVSKDKEFSFDHVFQPDASQSAVYNIVGGPAVDAVFKGYNACVFAYGQTGSGKTHSMLGEKGVEDDSAEGVIPRLARAIFENICAADDDVEFTVRATVVEIYCEKLKDLLDPAKDNLRIRESRERGVYIDDVTERYVTDEQDVMDTLAAAEHHRTWAVTNMNAHSSRAHLILQITLEQKTAKSTKTSKLSLVDLAGSERVQKTGASGARLEEAKGINTSLSALGLVIAALSEAKNGQFVPYRNSKLTRLLQESLGGNSRTCLLIACSPATFNEDETISTLRFGERAKMVQNHAKVNETRSAAELKVALEKADRIISAQAGRIQVLERCLHDNKIGVPAAEAALPAGSSAGDGLGGGAAGAPLAAGVVGAGITGDEMEELNELRDELRTLKDEQRELQDRIKQRDEAERRWKASLDSADAEKDQIKYQLAEAQDSGEKAKAAAAERDAEIEALKFDRRQAKERHKTHLRDAERVRQLLDVLVQKGDAEDPRKERMRYEGLVTLVTEGEAENGGADAEAAPPLELVVARAMRDLQSQRCVLVERAAELRAALEADRQQGQRAATDELTSRLDQARNQLTGQTDKLVAAQRRVEQLEAQVASQAATAGDSAYAEKPLKKKVAQLDKNLEQLTVMYHKLVAQNSAYKVENSISEKKLMRKDSRISSLEKALKDSKSKYEKLLTQCANLTSAMDAMGKLGGARRTNIARPIKGGAHKAE